MYDIRIDELRVALIKLLNMSPEDMQKLREQLSHHLAKADSIGCTEWHKEQLKARMVHSLRVLDLLIEIKKEKI